MVKFRIEKNHFFKRAKKKRNSFRWYQFGLVLHGDHAEKDLLGMELQGPVQIVIVVASCSCSSNVVAVVCCPSSILLVFASIVVFAVVRLANCVRTYSLDWSSPLLAHLFSTPS